MNASRTMNIQKGANFGHVPIREGATQEKAMEEKNKRWHLL